MRQSGWMRPSKFRLPESTDATDSAPSVIASRDLGRERPRVPDARRAAVADDVEAELGERLEQAGALVVVGDDE